MKRLKRYFPVGYSYGTEISFYITLQLIIILLSTTFISRLYSYEEFFKEGIKRGIDSADRFPKFIDLMYEIRLNIIVIFMFVVVIAFIGIHYAYHYRGSMSIYTMYRLKNKMDLHLRCLLVPLVFLVVGILVLAILLVFYHSLYDSVLTNLYHFSSTN